MLRKTWFWCCDVATGGPKREGKAYTHAHTYIGNNSVAAWSVILSIVCTESINPGIWFDSWLRKHKRVLSSTWHSGNLFPSTWIRRKDCECSVLQVKVVLLPRWHYTCGPSMEHVRARRQATCNDRIVQTCTNSITNRAHCTMSLKCNSSQYSCNACVFLHSLAFIASTPQNRVALGLELL